MKTIAVRRKGNYSKKKKKKVHTPLWILVSTFAISKWPSSQKAACHFLGLKVFPACENRLLKIKLQEQYCSWKNFIIDARGRKLIDEECQKECMKKITIP